MERWRILHKESNFTVIDNGVFKDPDLSFAEIGFLCKILSLPEGWHFNIEGIVSTVKEGRDYVYAIINRLIEHGYCKREQSKDEKTRRYKSYDYTFYEVKNGLGCASAPQTPFPYTAAPDTESPYTAKPTQLNTINNKELIKSSTKKKDISISKEKFNFLSSLKALGVSEKYAAEWLQVRKNKRLTNTETALNRIKAEIDKSGRSADDCIRIAVENSWGGFKAEWMPAEERKYETMEQILARLKK